MKVNGFLFLLQVIELFGQFLVSVNVLCPLPIILLPLHCERSNVPEHELNVKEALPIASNISGDRLTPSTVKFTPGRSFAPLMVIGPLASKS